MDVRLADLRMQHTKWTALTDTSSWDSTFFLSLIDSKSAEIIKLKAENRKLIRALERLSDENEKLNRRMATCRI